MIINNDSLNETVEGFREKYFFLSNMYVTPCQYNGLEFKSSEHLYQWLKVPDTERWWKDKIFNAPDGKVAKALAANEKCPHVIEKLGHPWTVFRIGIMDVALRSKFENRELRQRLIDTGSLNIVEHNTWGDTFWGVHRGTGKNHLGKMLMGLRTEYMYFD